MIGQPLSIQGLHKTYPGNAHPVFDGFDLEVEAGNLCAIVGVSGVGKTTLLNCVAGLDHWEGGHISVGGESVPEGAEARALYRRRRVGLAFQQPHLLPEFTVRENLRMPLLIEGDVSAEAESWIDRLLATLNSHDRGLRRYLNFHSANYLLRNLINRKVPEILGDHSYQLRILDGILRLHYNLRRIRQ